MNHLQVLNSVISRTLLENDDMSACIIEHDVMGFVTTALSLRFPHPHCALGGGCGMKRITAVANCCLPAPLQESLGDNPRAWRRYFKEVTGTLFPSVPPARLAVLSTGVDIEHIAVQEESYDGLHITALVTAGVKSNAMRLGVDRAGTCEEHPPKPGTINTILVTNASLPVSALASSFITATEAKVIALEEMDIRSTFSPELRATGTGTDQVLVIGGSGHRQQYVGGHTVLGRLMARAVTAATKIALENTYSL